MTTIYQKQGASPAVKALAGDSPGTSANWLESGTPELWATWQSAHGATSILSAQTWELWKARYLEPLNVGGPGAGFSTQQKFELGQAGTSTAILVNEHIDETGYDIALSNGVTGTATPDSA